MFAIGRLNGNNFHLGSIDVTTSQLYTGTLTFFFTKLTVSRFVHHFCTIVLLCKSHFHWYTPMIQTIDFAVLWLVGASCVVVGGHASLFAIDRNPFEPAEANV
jgi:general stress protein CsbA